MPVSRSYEYLMPCLRRDTLMILTLLYGVNAARAEQCEITGLDLLEAYERGMHNDLGFGCWYRINHGKWNRDASYTVVPSPNGLHCKHSAPFFHWADDDHYDFSLSFFRQGLRDGWKVRDYVVRGKGRKITTEQRRVLFLTTKPRNEDWQLTLRKIWIEKEGISCNNMQAVMDGAFGPSHMDDLELFSGIDD